MEEIARAASVALAQMDAITLEYLAGKAEGLLADGSGTVSADLLPLRELLAAQTDAAGRHLALVARLADATIQGSRSWAR